MLFAAIWLRSREAGTRTVALGFAVTALWYLNAHHLVFASPNIGAAQRRAWSHVILIGVMAVTFGVVQYLGAPRGWWRVLLAPHPLSHDTVEGTAVGSNLPVKASAVPHLPRCGPMAAPRPGAVCLDERALRAMHLPVVAAAHLRGQRDRHRAGASAQPTAA